jgi:hypothetical protein
MLYQHSRVSSLVALILLIMLAITAVAQNPMGRITGVIQDPTGAVVPNASIVVTNEATNVKYAATGSAEGGFVVPSLPAGSYTVEISAAGFSNAIFKQVKVDPGKEYSLTAKLTLASGNQVVEVTAGQELVNTTTTEVSDTVSTRQVQNLPLNGRDIIGLISTQAGVGTSGRTSTTINGTRPSWSQVTLDGINIQDLYIRTNALDYIPNRPTTDTVSEFTISGSTQGANATLGATGVRMITPSGTNAFHGSVYEYNRNAAVEANDWFNNYSGVKRPPFNRNEFGATLGGPVVKNKLFFYGYYAGLRTRTQSNLNQVIPAHDDYLNGQFRYVPTSGPMAGTVQSINVMNLTGGAAGSTPVLPIDSVITGVLKGTPAASLVNNYQVGNSTSSMLLNTAGRTITQSNNNDRDNFGFKIDYEVSERHHLDFTYSHMHEVTQRPDYDPMLTSPRVYNDSTPQLFSGGWRWTISNTFINTVRIGANLAPAPFITTGDSPSFLLATSSVANTGTLSGIGISPSFLSMLPQGRKPAVHQYMDDATWVKGNHNLTFGGSWQTQNIYTYDAAGTIPTYTTGFDYAPDGSEPGLANYALTAANFPTAISATDLANANALRAFLAGYLASGTQSFNVSSKTSGYVPGAQQDRNLQLNDYSLYTQDQWRVRPNITLTLGVKWEYVSPYKETNGLMLGAVYGSNAVASLFNNNGTIDFMKKAYRSDWNNFGPTVGVAWDPFKNGKTVIRGGYTLTYVNDDIYRFAGNASDGNAGLSSSVLDYYGYWADGVNHTLAGGVPTVNAPTFQMPRTYADQLSLNPTNVVWALDPNIHTPMVHQISFGIEHELPKNMSVSARYVGTLGRDLLRGLDLNQTNGGTNAPYLADFAKARSNGFLALAATGKFDPRYNSSVAGSVPLTVLPYFGAGAAGDLQGYLTNSTVRNYIMQNAAATLADFYTQNRDYFPGAAPMFLPNPGIYAIDFGTNQAQNSYHALQVEAKRRYASGLQWQANYTWAKNLSTSPYGETGQTRFDPLLDNARPQLAKARSAFDLRHAFKMNAIYDMPFGKGKAFLNMPGVVDKIVGGWQLSGIYSWQSGNPFAITDTRGTFNKPSRSSTQTPISTLTVAQIKANLGVVKNSTGIFYINPALLDPNTLKGVGTDTLDNSATFANQVFFNPGAGQIGNLPYLAFDAPAYQNLDLGLAKSTAITERVNTTFRADFFNAPNHPTFYFGDRDVNSTGFGKITSTNTTARQIQFSLKLTF